MVKAMASNSSNPTLRNILDDAFDELKRADEKLVDSANKYFTDPDSNHQKQELKDACDDIYKLVDKIIDEVKPVATVARTSPHHGHVSPSDLENAAIEMKRAVDKAEEFEKMTPKQHVHATTKASEKASDFAGKVAAHAQQVKNPQLQNDLQQAYRDLDRANEALVDATNKYIADNNGSNKRAIDNAAAELKAIADDIMDKVKPKVNRADRLSPLNRKVTPNEVEQMAQIVKKSLNELNKFPHDAPKTIAANTEDSSQKTEQLKQLIDTMLNQTESPTMINRLNKASDDLDKLNDELVNASQRYINDPNDRTERDLKDKSKELNDTIDRIIKDVRPIVEYSDRKSVV